MPLGFSEVFHLINKECGSGLCTSITLGGVGSKTVILSFAMKIQTNYCL